MKKVVLTLLLIASIGSAAHAQIATEMGLTLANLSLKSMGTKVPTSFKPGYIGGFAVGLRFTPHIFFEPGIFFDMTGAKTTDNPTGKYTISSINIPFNIEYKTGLKCGNRFFVGAGIYFTDNLSAVNTTDAYGTIPATSTVLKIGSDATSSIKEMDFGFGVNAGYLFKNHFYFRARYQMGLLNLLPSGDNDNSIKTSEINVTIGYSFGRCRIFYSSGGRSHGPNHWRGMSKAKYSRRVQHQWSNR